MWHNKLNLCKGDGTVGGSCGRQSGQCQGEQQSHLATALLEARPRFQDVEEQPQIL